jgi:hypothetical protein
MSESEPRRVPINLAEVIDEEAPLVLEMIRAQRVVALANRALEVVGVELVVNAEVPDMDLPSTIGMDEASGMITAARREELARFAFGLHNLVKTNLDSTEVLSKLMSYIEFRSQEIDRLSSRGPE